MPATKGVSEQDILLLFEESEEPFLTASEIADELGVTNQAVNYHLKQMEEEGKVGRKKVGSRAVGWWAKVAPKLDPEVAEELDNREDEEFVPLNDYE